MKITCTKQEKERLLSCIYEAFIFPCSTDCSGDCDKCIDEKLEKEIEWEITDEP